MLDIVECIRHCSLKSCARNFEAKWEFAIRKCSPWAYKCGFVLIRKEYVYLIVAKKSIHEWKIFIPGTVIDNLVDIISWIIVLVKSFINILVIKTYSNSSLFFINEHNIWYPISQRNGVDESCFQQFFNLSLDSGRFSWMYRM